MTPTPQTGRPGQRPPVLPTAVVLGVCLVAAANAGCAAKSSDLVQPGDNDAGVPGKASAEAGVADATGCDARALTLAFRVTDAESIANPSRQPFEGQVKGEVYESKAGGQSSLQIELHGNEPPGCLFLLASVSGAVSAGETYPLDVLDYAGSERDCGPRWQLAYGGRGQLKVLERDGGLFEAELSGPMEPGHKPEFWQGAQGSFHLSASMKTHCFGYRKP